MDLGGEDGHNRHASQEERRAVEPRHRVPQMGQAVPLLSIIIPTRNAATTLPATVATVTSDNAPDDAEIVVVDGGSADGTMAVARRLGATVIDSEPGRGRQLSCGAGAAAGDWLLFLHADTRLDRGWREAVRDFIDVPANAGRAAYFSYALDDTAWLARRLEAIVRWRSRALGLPYGDQGLLISRAFYDDIGGFRPLVLMEDVDIVRRIGRRRLTMLDCRAVTSAARYKASGYLPRALRNVMCLSLYFLGVPPRMIARIYG